MRYDEPTFRWAKQIVLLVQIRPLAQAEHISHEADLAVLKVSRPVF